MRQNLGETPANGVIAEPGLSRHTAPAAMVLLLFTCLKERQQILYCSKPLALPFIRLLIFFCSTPY
jgi:hypothetical protein